MSNFRWLYQGRYTNILERAYLLCPFITNEIQRREGCRTGRWYGLALLQGSAAWKCHEVPLSH